MGNLSAGAGVAGLVALPLLGSAINRYGWEVGAVGLGATVFLGSIAMALVLRPNPERYGLLPDGETTPQGGTAADGGRQPAGGEETSFTLPEALHTSAFWMLTGSYVMRYVGIASVSLHLVPHLTAEGIAPELAAFALGLALALSIPGRMLFGWAGDRYDKRYTMAVCLLLQAAALLTATFAGTAIALIYIYALLWGMGMGSEPLGNALRAELFGRTHYGKISGFQMPVGQVGRLIGAMMGGLVFDATESYAVAFFVGVSGFTLSAVLAGLIRPPGRPSPGLEHTVQRG